MKMSKISFGQNLATCKYKAMNLAMVTDEKKRAKFSRTGIIVVDGQAIKAGQPIIVTNIETGKAQKAILKGVYQDATSCDEFASFTPGIRFKVGKKPIQEIGANLVSQFEVAIRTIAKRA